ncbi:protein claret segregational [Zophobas morio]
MVVSNEKNSLIKEFANQKKEYQNLTDSYDNCQEKYNILLETEKNLKEKNRNLLDENSTLKAKLSNQESKFWLHTSFNTLEELTKECLQKISNTEKIPQEPALCNTLLENWCKDLENITLKLKRDLDKQDDPRRSLRNTIQDVTGNIRVFCRIRPPITSEENERQLCAMSFPNETSLEIRKARKSVNVLSGKLINLKQKFTFDKVFPPDVTQAEVFEELGQLVQSALDGYHVCVFAYGQPGSGKTYTMQGSSNDCGIIPRTIDLIFQKIDKLSTLDWNYSVTASFLELYNENIRDLLLPNSTHNYEVRYNEGHGITVTNLQIIPITSAEELKLLMEEAQKNRTVAATNSNEHSSRSHAITKIHLEGYNETSKVKYSGSIHLVDLAGSESARTTNAERLNETKNINTSLSALGNVMLALYNKHPHIPYRNSKLTFLLQSCLGGNSKTLMFVNVSPFEECFGESINSLRFASKIKEIKTVAKKNKTYAFQCYH